MPVLIMECRSEHDYLGVDYISIETPNISDLTAFTRLCSAHMRTIISPVPGANAPRCLPASVEWDICETPFTMRAWSDKDGTLAELASGDTEKPFVSSEAFETWLDALGDPDEAEVYIDLARICVVFSIFRPEADMWNFRASLKNADTAIWTDPINRLLA